MTTVASEPPSGVAHTHEAAPVDSGLTGDTVELRVRKGLPGEPARDVTYEVPMVTGMVVLDAVHYVQHNLDTDLA